MIQLERLQTVEGGLDVEFGHVRQQARIRLLRCRHRRPQRLYIGSSAPVVYASLHLSSAIGAY